MKPFLGFNFDQLNATALAHGAIRVWANQELGPPPGNEPIGGVFQAWMAHDQYVWLTLNGLVGFHSKRPVSQIPSNAKRLIGNYAQFGFERAVPRYRRLLIDALARKAERSPELQYVWDKLTDMEQTAFELDLATGTYDCVTASCNKCGHTFSDHSPHCLARFEDDPARCGCQAFVCPTTS